MELKTLSVSDLLSFRSWLGLIGGSGTVEHNRKVADRITDVDNLLWHHLMKGKSPWDNAKRYSDDNFDDTLEDLREGKLDVSDESSGPSVPENS